MRMSDLYIQTNDLVAGYWFAGDLDARVNEAQGTAHTDEINCMKYETCV